MFWLFSHILNCVGNRKRFPQLSIMRNIHLKVTPSSSWFTPLTHFNMRRISAGSSCMVCSGPPWWQISSFATDNLNSAKNEQTFMSFSIVKRNQKFDDKVMSEVFRSRSGLPPYVYFIFNSPIRKSVLGIASTTAPMDVTTSAKLSEAYDKRWIRNVINNVQHCLVFCLRELYV